MFFTFASSRFRQLLFALGPGLLMAGAAVGVSHLVQSTRAGAEYGTSLLLLVLLACVFKYPFLEFGPRYAAATGENLLVGYRRLGRWALGLFVIVTLGTMLIIQAGVTVVAAGLAGLVFDLDASITQLSAGVLTGCLAVLAIGRYRGLDLLMKIIMAALAVSTLAAVALAFGSGPDWSALNPAANLDAVWTATGFAFVLALLGWMPIPLDVAAWHSLWTLERAEQTGHPPSVRDSITDFQIGYAGATLLAVLFLLLGALMLHGSQEAMPESSVAFSGRLVDLYALTLGEWSRPVIAVAALTTMFSTTLAVTDAYPRVLRALIELSGIATDEGSSEHKHRARYVGALLLVTIGALLVIHYFGQRFTTLIDFATTVSFLAAPVIAWLNIKLLTSEHVPTEHRPRGGLLVLAWAGLGFLVLFCVIWIGWRLT
ncbi:MULTISPECIES: Nramp family divalent metal transporter [unclassified Wenzhouxiangella]|uniref:Nramp family divalent metal transporter n=1 Tax=unclassified Wenzhouxiangella TaxID=2613841 RepID=UPI002162815B|nr:MULTISPECIES: Nramp family divalent metal transporter [unclassified Wenzhouxiangella]